MHLSKYCSLLLIIWSLYMINDRTKNENREKEYAMKDYKWERALCVCFLYGWLDNCVCARQNQWERVWLENRNSFTPTFRSSPYTQLLYLNHLYHHTHTQAAQKQPVKRKEAGEVEEGREGEQERGVLGSQRIELFRDSTLFSAILTDRGEAVTSGGRETGRRSQTYTHMRVTPASGVCHECIIVCYFTAAAEVLWLLLKSLWAAWSLCISELRFLTQMCERSQRNEA